MAEETKITEPKMKPADYNCPNCNNSIGEKSPRVEINGAITRVTFDSKGQKQLGVVARGSAYCNINCLAAFITRL